MFSQDIRVAVAVEPQIEAEGGPPSDVRSVEGFIDRTPVHIVPRPLAGGGGEGARLSFFSCLLKLYLHKRDVLLVSLSMGRHQFVVRELKISIEQSEASQKEGVAPLNLRPLLPQRGLNLEILQPQLISNTELGQQSVQQLLWLSYG